MPTSDWVSLSLLPALDGEQASPCLPATHVSSHTPPVGQRI